jgi:hypothetical protein
MLSLLGNNAFTLLPLGDGEGWCRQRENFFKHLGCAPELGTEGENVEEEDKERSHLAPEYLL